MHDTAKALRQIRERSGKTWEWMADELKIPLASYAKYETGEEATSLEMSFRICVLLHTTPVALLGWRDTSIGWEPSEEDKALIEEVRLRADTEPKPFEEIYKQIYGDYPQGRIVSKQ